MKKFYSILIMCMMFVMTSCITSAQSLSYYDEYLYLDTYYPVVYINSYPYYFYNSHWVRIHFDNYRLIRHLDRPYYYNGPHHQHFSNRGYISRPPMNHRPDAYPNSRFDNHQPQIYHRPNGEVRRYDNNQRPPVIRGNHGNSQHPQTSRPQQNNRGAHPQGNHGGRR